MKIFDIFKKRRAIRDLVAALAAEKARNNEARMIVELRGRVAAATLEKMQDEADLERLAKELADCKNELHRAKEESRERGYRSVQSAHALRTALEFIDAWTDEEWADKIASRPHLRKDKTLKEHLVHELTMFLTKEPEDKPGLYDLNLILKEAGLDKRVPGETMCRFVAKARAEQTAGRA